MRVKGLLQKYFSDYKFNSLLFRNLLLLLSLVLIPLSGMAGISYYAYKNIQMKERESTSERVTDDIYSDLRNILKEAEMQLIYISMNSNVELYLYDDEAIRQFNYKISSIQELIKMPVIAKDYVESIWVYSPKNNRVITQEGVAVYESFGGRDKLEAYLNRREDQPGLMVTKDIMRDAYHPQLTVFQEIRYGKQLNGVSCINLDAAKLLKELDIPENMQIYLTDGETILLSDEKELAGRPVEEIREYDRVIHGGIYSDSLQSICSMVSEDSPLEVITRMDMSGYNDQLDTIRNIMLLFLLVMTLVTLVLAVAVSVRVFRPIEKIMSSIQEYRNALMGEEELFRNKDELEYILTSIKRTMKAKKNTEEELAERVRLLKKAQAVALQSQINPHFLNNTLETINWIAIELLGGKNEISRMAGALSRMLRMTLENTDSVIPVSMEIRHCMYYLEIQKTRYEDKFEVSWQIPEEMKECRIIRIVLQPLIENAIYHGIKPMTNKGQIVISGQIDGDLLLLTVSDNGIGMARQDLLVLQRSMQSDMIRESRHIGIANVNQRIKLYYGEEYGLTVESTEGIGTSVTVKIPRVNM